MTQGLQAHGGGIRLPDRAKVPHRQGLRLPRQNQLCQVHQHAIAQFSRVIDPENGHLDVVGSTEMLEDALPAQTTQRIFPHRAKRRLLS